MKYQEVLPISRQEAEKAFESNDSSQISDALLRVTYYDSDWSWIQSKCLEFIKYQDKNIRGLAVTCLGHLARIHGTLDVDKVVPILESLSDDPEISGKIDDALDDIQMFVSE